jgi:hypothetical protein
MGLPPNRRIAVKLRIVQQDQVIAYFTNCTSVCEYRGVTVRQEINTNLLCYLQIAIF